MALHLIGQTLLQVRQALLQLNQALLQVSQAPVQIGQEDMRCVRGHTTIGHRSVLHIQ